MANKASLETATQKDNFLKRTHWNSCLLSFAAVGRLDLCWRRALCTSKLSTDMFAYKIVLTCFGMERNVMEMSRRTYSETVTGDTKFTCKHSSDNAEHMVHLRLQSTQMPAANTSALSLAK